MPIFYFLVLLTAFLAEASASNCKPAFIKQIADNGNLIIDESNQVFRVNPGDNFKSTFWFPNSPALFCELPGFEFKGKIVRFFEVINTANNQSVSASLRPLGRCEDDTLSKNIDSGRKLLTTSGSLLDVLPGDNFDSMLWLAGSSLLICAEEIVFQGNKHVIFSVFNLDDGEEVGATKR